MCIKGKYLINPVESLEKKTLATVMLVENGIYERERGKNPLYVLYHPPNQKHETITLPYLCITVIYRRNA